MNIEDFSDIINKTCNDDVKGLIIIKLNKNDTFEAKNYGEISYLETIGMLHSVCHDFIDITNEQ